MRLQDNATYAYQYLLNAGFSPQAAAGIVGNLNVESAGFSDDVINGTRRGDNGSAYGIAQWRGDRFRGLQNYAEANGGDWRNLDTQLGYLVDEMQSGRDRGAATAFNRLQSVETPEEAAQIFMQHYERPDADPSVNFIGRRQAFAQNLYNNVPAEGAEPVVASAFQRTADGDMVPFDLIMPGAGSPGMVGAGEAIPMPRPALPVSPAEVPTPATPVSAPTPVTAPTPLPPATPAPAEDHSLLSGIKDLGSRLWDSATANNRIPTPPPAPANPASAATIGELGGKIMSGKVAVPPMHPQSHGPTMPSGRGSMDVPGLLSTDYNPMTLDAVTGNNPFMANVPVKQSLAGEDLTAGNPFLLNPGMSEDAGPIIQTHNIDPKEDPMSFKTRSFVPGQGFVGGGQNAGKTGGPVQGPNFPTLPDGVNAPKPTPKPTVTKPDFLGVLGSIGMMMAALGGGGGGGQSAPSLSPILHKPEQTQIPIMKGLI